MVLGVQQPRGPERHLETPNLNAQATPLPAFLLIASPFSCPVFSPSNGAFITCIFLDRICVDPSDGWCCDLRMPVNIEHHGHSLGAGGLTATCIHNIRPREFHSDYTSSHGKEEIFIPFNVLLTVMPCHVGRVSSRL